MYRLKSINELINANLFSHFNADGHLVLDLDDSPQDIIPERILGIIEITSEKNSTRQKYPVFEKAKDGSFYCSEAGIIAESRYDQLFVNFRVDNLGLLFLDNSDITAH